MSFKISGNISSQNLMNAQKAANNTKPSDSRNIDGRNLKANHVNTHGTVKTAKISANDRVNDKLAVRDEISSARKGIIPQMKELITIDGDSCKIENTGRIMLDESDMYKEKYIDQSKLEAFTFTFRTREEERQYNDQKINDMLTSFNSFKLIGSDGKASQTITLYLNGDVNAKNENGYNASMSDMIQQRKWDDIVSTDKNGQPITYGMLMLQDVITARSITNSYYSKYITMNSSNLNLVKAMANPVYNGMNDAEKCKAVLNEMTAGTDYAGLSDEEKYSAIHDKYAGLFGKNFLTAGAIDYHDSNTDYVHKLVLEQFDNELLSVFGSTDKAAEAARSALYGDMDAADVRAEIAAKYPSGDEMTLRDLYNMTWEMKQVGVDGGMRDVVENATDFFKHIRLPIGFDVSPASYTRMREGLLDQKLDIGYLSNAYNGMLSSGKVTSETGQIMQEQLGVSLDTNGSASPSKPDSANWFQSVVNWVLNDDVVSNRYAELKQWTAQTA